MQLYLDSSALVKLVVEEPESAALRNYVDGLQSDARFTAAVARTELVRAIARRGSVEAVQHARRLLGRLDTVVLTSRLLDAAATMLPRELLSLDAIHLAAAITAPNLRAFVTYDSRLARAAADAGVAVVDPR